MALIWSRTWASSSMRSWRSSKILGSIMPLSASDMVGSLDGMSLGRFESEILGRCLVYRCISDICAGNGICVERDVTSTEYTNRIQTQWFSIVYYYCEIYIFA